MQYYIQTTTLKAMKSELTRLGFALPETLRPFDQVQTETGNAVAIYLGNIPIATGEVDSEGNAIYERESAFSANIIASAPLDIQANTVEPKNPYNRFI